VQGERGSDIDEMKGCRQSSINVCYGIIEDDNPPKVIRTLDAGISANWMSFPNMTAIITKGI
jgi:hypothetical protein